MTLSYKAVLILSYSDGILACEATSIEDRLAANVGIVAVLAVETVQSAIESL
jgi:hypothetical protein